MILNNQESCNINGRKAKKYSKLERRDQQGDPISAYKYLSQKYFLYLLKRLNPKVKGFNIFKHEFLYNAYVNDTTFFLKDTKSITELIR